MRIGQREIGPGLPCVIVAELGINHGADLSLAFQMVDAAAGAGVDAVKVQVFNAENFCTSDATYNGERQIDLFRRHELPRDAFRAIAERCKVHGLGFFGTPDSYENAGVLLGCGATVIKVGSDDLVHVPFLRGLGRLRIPLILSTGMATRDEVLAAVQAVGDAELVLLHCVSLYPTPATKANLTRMLDLAQLVPGVPVGYSDHTDGITASLAAVAMGACMIEKHFTLDRTLPGPDQAFSADPVQMAALVRGVREIEAMESGPGLAEPDADEAAMRTLARRSIVAAHALDAGTHLTWFDLAYKRPGTGLPPGACDAIIGRRLTRDLRADEQVRLEDVA